MPKRKPKRSYSFDPVPLLNGFLLLVGIGNVVAILFFECTRKPRVDRVETTVITNHLIVVTNYISSVSESHLSLPSTFTNKFSALDQRVERVPYKLYFWAGRPYMTMGGFEFGVGSPTSFGRILEIYPDRFLTDRCWVVNSTFSLNSSSLGDKIHSEGMLK